MGREVVRFVTAVNQHGPWLMFEESALAKHLESARIISLFMWPSLERAVMAAKQRAAAEEPDRAKKDVGQQILRL